MKKNMNRWIAVSTLGVMGIAGMGLTSGTAQAKKSTIWKYATILGAAATGYGLVEGDGTVATVGAAATAGSYYMYKHSKKNEEERRQDWYRNRYGRDWRRHYSPKAKKHQNRSRNRRERSNRRDRREEQRRQEWYRNRYGNNWRSHYRPGRD